MKVYKTAAHEADHELTELLGIENRLYKEGVLDGQLESALRLATTFEELKLVIFEPYQYRPGFEVSEDKVILPCIFAKVDGTASDLMSKAREWKQSHNKTTLVYGGFHMLDQMPTSHALQQVNGSTQLENAVSLAYLSPLNRTSVIQAIKQVLVWFKDELTIEYNEDIMIAALLYDNKTIIDAFHYNELTATVPKCFIEDNQKKTPSGVALARMLLMHLLGFDVVVVSKHSFSSIENYLNKDWYDHHLVNDEKVKDKSKWNTNRLVLIGIVSILIILVLIIQSLLK